MPPNSKDGHLLSLQLNYIGRIKQIVSFLNWESQVYGVKRLHTNERHNHECFIDKYPLFCQGFPWPLKDILRPGQKNSTRGPGKPGMDCKMTRSYFCSTTFGKIFLHITLQVLGKHLKHPIRTILLYHNVLEPI